MSLATRPRQPPPYRETGVAIPLSHCWESAKVSHKRVFALLTPEIHSYELTQMLQKTSVRAPGLSADECEHPFAVVSQTASKVPEGHHPRGTTL